MTFYRQNQLALDPKNGQQYPDVFAEGKTASSLTDNEKISLLEGEWNSNDLFKFIKVWKIHSTLIPNVVLNSYFSYGS